MFDVGGKTWKSYDWSQITTVALFGKYDSELMCYAHSKGARVVLKGECQFLPDVSRQLVSLLASFATLTFKKIPFSCSSGIFFSILNSYILCNSFHRYKCY